MLFNMGAEAYTIVSKLRLFACTAIYNQAQQSVDLNKRNFKTSSDLNVYPENPFQLKHIQILMYTLKSFSSVAYSDLNVYLENPFQLEHIQILMYTLKSFSTEAYSDLNVYLENPFQLKHMQILIIDLIC